MSAYRLCSPLHQKMYVCLYYSVHCGSLWSCLPAHDMTHTMHASTTACQANFAYLQHDIHSACIWPILLAAPQFAETTAAYKILYLVCTLLAPLACLFADLLLIHFCLLSFIDVVIWLCLWFVSSSIFCTSRVFADLYIYT